MSESWYVNDGEGIRIKPLTKVSASEIIFTIAPDGTVTLGAGVTLDEASRAFWRAVGEMGHEAWRIVEAIAERGAWYEDSSPIDHDAYCAFCGTTMDAAHSADCLVTRARALVAARGTGSGEE